MNKYLSVIYKHLAPEKYARKIGVRIGKNCRIGNSNWGSEPYLISIGDHVTLSSNVTFLTHDGATWVFREKTEYKGVNKFGAIVISDNCFIGWGVTLLPGIRIGSDSIVGVGALVTKSIRSGEVWGGVPAHFLMTTAEYAEKCKEGPGCVPFEEGTDKKEILIKHLIGATNDASEI